MKIFFKKLIGILFDKDVWILAMIDTACTAVFIFGGGYVAFVTSINPTYKTIFLVVLAITLYFLCGVIERAVFRKLGRKPPE